MSTDKPGVILAVNAGSGSLTLQAWWIDTAGRARLSDEAPFWTAKLSRHDEPSAVIRCGDQKIEITADDLQERSAGGDTGDNGSALESQPTGGDARDNGTDYKSRSADGDAGSEASDLESALLAAVIERLWSGDHAPLSHAREVRLMGHRIVHSGTEPLDGDRHPPVREAERIDQATMENIRRAAAYAPLHNPPALNTLTLLKQKLPDAVAVAVYDTSFHRGLPQSAAVYGGPYQWFERGFKRVGFHGIALEDALRRSAALLDRPAKELQIVVVHLGGGCSATAIRHGDSVDTTMGLTPADGMIMAERSGDVDPGMLLHIATTDELAPDALRNRLIRNAGLKGLSGTTGDIGRAHRLASDGDRRAQLAVNAYVLAVRRGVGRVLVSLERLDALVLNGSALEGQAWLRAAIVHGLSALGLVIDEEKNAAQAEDITGKGSRARILQFQVDEERVIAETTLAFLDD